jgi:hypothetical protein
MHPRMQTGKTLTRIRDRREFEPERMAVSGMAMRSAFPPRLPVLDKLRTLTELDPETVELLAL